MKSRVPTLFNLTLSSIVTKHSLFKDNFNRLPKELTEKINAVNEIRQAIKNDSCYGKPSEKYYSPPYICHDRENSDIFHLRYVTIYPGLVEAVPFVKTIASFSLEVVDNEVTIVNQSKDSANDNLKFDAETLKKLTECLSHETVKTIRGIMPMALLPEKEIPINYFGPCL